MDEKTSPSEAAVWSSFPGDLLHRADDKDIRKSSQQCDDRHNHESHDESPGVIDYESGHCRCDDSRKISEEILQAPPSARHSRPGQSLCHRPYVGSAHATGCECQ